MIDPNELAIKVGELLDGMMNSLGLAEEVSINRTENDAILSGVLVV